MTTGYTRYQAEAVLARAASAGGDGGDRLTIEELERAAAEVGLEPDEVRAAAIDLEEGFLPQGPPSLLDRLMGPARLLRRWDLGRPPAAVRLGLDRYLVARRLQPAAGRGEWQLWRQRVAWWPDLHRTWGDLELETRVSPTAHGSRLRVRIRLDTARATHLALTLAVALAAVALVGWAIRAPLSLAAAPLALAAAVPLAARTFRVRIRRIGDRLDGMADTLASGPAGRT